MTTAWVTIGVLWVMTFAIKGFGPLVLGARRPSDRALAVIALLSPAVISSLIVYETFGGHPTGLLLDARAAGLVAAAGAVAARLPAIVVILLAAGTTALVSVVT